jgi:hypothetical protein
MMILSLCNFSDRHQRVDCRLKIYMNNCEMKILGCLDVNIKRIPTYLKIACGVSSRDFIIL